MYLGRAVGQARSVVLAGLEQLPPEHLRDSLSALRIPRKGAREPRALAQCLLDGAPHALLATPEAVERYGLVLPSADAEAAALQQLMVAAAADDSGSTRTQPGVAAEESFAVDCPMDDGELWLIAAQTVFTVASRVQAVRRRPLAPTEGRSAHAASEGVDEAQSEAQTAELADCLADYALSMLQHAAALTGCQLSQLPDQALVDLKVQALHLLRRRMLSGQTLVVPSQQGHSYLSLQATQYDLEQLAAAIRALQLPPAPGVLRCAACGAAEHLPICKLRRCAACRQARLKFDLAALWMQSE
ncbi:hypothetical protein COHA_010038 [Chlorella ohadii]|uniref:Uncharacterized protein n=1 Tax=Chlorella ohadii TaxID=2649997 RepID=A0AAD5DKL1_9CHLO|nr:hypothetical protein COHA_010038 [Chlorella ohadii]